VRRARFLPALLFLFSWLPWHAPAQAASVCISTTSGLIQAINSFDTQPDGSTLTIKLVQGTYGIGNALGQSIRSAYPNVVGLQLLGGYTVGCASRQINPANTVIDGLNQAEAGLDLNLEGDAGLLVEGITFTRITGSHHRKSVLSFGLDAGTSDVATYRIRFNRFVRNSARTIVELSGAQLFFVNNLVSDNALSGAAPGWPVAAVHVEYSYDADTLLSATNNTIANNSGGAGLLVDTRSQSSNRPSDITSNILWGNGTDLDLSSFDTSVNAISVGHNIVGTVSGFTLPSGNSGLDPRFINAAGGNYGLASNSPAINSGPAFQLWGFPARDLAGGARIVGSLIDRGAFESSIDDSTTAVVTTTSDNGNNTSPLAGSLRAAIKAGNAASGPFRIIFNVAGGCPRMLSLAAPMLDITGDVTIDGTTQSGWTPNDQYGQFNANLCFFVNGAGNANTPWALHVPSGAPNSARLVVRGLGFAGFTDAAIKLEGGRNHRIAGNLFGPVPFTPANNNAIRVTGNSGGAFIGGYDDPSALNLIAVAAGAGIYLDNAGGGSTVANNVIGFQADGTGSGGNASGIYVYNSPGNVVQYNAIGNNASHGVILAGSGSSGNLVQYNTIGVDLNGGAAGNGSGGVLVTFAAKNNTIGAPVGATWGGNFIDNNGGPGVWISASGGAGNRVLDNAFQGNVGLDIDLAQSGPSANQPANPATGPNNLQNYPVLASAVRDVANATETVTGTLTSTPDTTYRLDLYWGAACLPNGRGYARYPLMKTYLTTGALGSVSFTTSVAFGWTLPVGAISATVTDPAGNTSEIGNCVAETLSDRIFKNGFE
jgi:hypothetical protein